MSVDKNRPLDPGQEKIRGQAGAALNSLEGLLEEAEASHLMMFALKKEVFDLLEHGRTAGELAEMLGFDTRKTKAFLDALAAIGLLEKGGLAKNGDGTYRLSSLSALYLKSSSPFCSRELLERRFARLLSPRELEVSLSRPSEGSSVQRSGPNPAKKDPLLFTRIMVQHARGSGNLSKLTHLVCRHPRFFQARRMLDLGGGHGLYAAALCRINPELEGVVFDFPEIVEVARRYIAKTKLESRITTRGGDFYSDFPGEGYQIVLAVNAIHRSPEILRDVLEKVFLSLDSGGVLYLQHRYLNRSRTAPRKAALFYFNRILEVDSFYLPTLREAREAGEKAGFHLTGLFRYGGGDTCLRLERR